MSSFPCIINANWEEIQLQRHGTCTHCISAHRVWECVFILILIFTSQCFLRQTISLLLHLTLNATFCDIAFRSFGFWIFHSLSIFLSLVVCFCSFPFFRSLDIYTYSARYCSICSKRPQNYSNFSIKDEQTWLLFLSVFPFCRLQLFYYTVDVVCSYFLFNVSVQIIKFP